MKSQTRTHLVVVLLAIVVAITLSNSGQAQAQPATQTALIPGQSSAASAIKQQSKPARPAATITVCASGCDYTTIQAAVNAASNGDTIAVGAGNYVEQVMITKTLTLSGAGATSTYIRAPNPMTTITVTNPITPSQSQAVKDIVTISGTVSVNMSGFSAAGPGPGGCGSIDYGIFVVGGANVNFNNNHVYSVRDQPFSGCQNGIAIRVGSRFLGQTGSGIVSNSVFTDNQKSAVIFDGPGVSGTISGNTITGNGPTSIIAQNGIQVSRSAVTTITNNVISGWYYSNYPNSASGCVEVYNAGNTTVANNLVSGCNVGIDPGNDEALTAIGSFTNNVVTGTNSAGDYGIAIGDGWGGSLVANNNVSNAIWGIYSYDVPVTITANLVHSNSNGIYLDTFSGLTGAANDTITFNRIVSNTTGLFNNVPAAATAINNWWGCNAGPGGAGCDTVGGSLLRAGQPERPHTVPVDGPAQGKRPVTRAKVAAPLGAVTSNPWLTLHDYLSSPGPIAVGASAVDTASLTINSNNQDTSGLGHIRDYTPVAFTATHGTVSPPYTGTLNGLALSTFTASSAGTANVCSIVDNQNACASITVQGVPTITYANQAWAGLPCGTDPDGSGPAIAMCYDSFAVVQPAINAVTDPGTTYVYTGTYPEQLTITKTLNFIGSSSSLVRIQAPNPMTTIRIRNPYTPTLFLDVADIVTISGTKNITMTGFTVAGPGPGGCGSIDYGIFVVGGANLNFHNNRVDSVRDNPFSGCQNGIGLRLGSAYLGQVATGIIATNVFSDNQKGDLILSGPGSSGNVSGNSFTGAGNTPIIGQNGIEVLDGAIGTITGNTLAGYAYTGPTYVATAMLPIDSPSYTITNNLISASQVGIYNYIDNGSSTAFSITNNLITGRSDPSDEGIIAYNEPGRAGIDSGVPIKLSPLREAGAKLKGQVKPTSFAGSTIANNAISATAYGIELGSDGMNINTNLIHLNTYGILVDSGTNATVGSSASFNRIVSNTVGIYNTDTSLFNAPNNWWGCNTGPNTPGCDTEALVNFTPWLTLHATTNPPVIPVGGTAVNTGTLTINSLNMDTSALGHVPNYTPMYFTATLGTMSPPYTGTINGIATSTFTANTPGVAQVCTRVDNQNVCNNVIVNPLATATPTRTPSPTPGLPTPIPTSTDTSTPTSTATNTPVPPTNTATNTPVPPTNTPTRTNTPVPPTSTATSTPVPPTSTATNTLVPPTATSTNTPVPPTATSTNTPTRTNTPLPATNTPTSTPLRTNTPRPTATECPMYFPDVPTEYWAYGYIKYLYCRGYVTGYPDGYFRPNNNIIRAEFSAIVARAFGFPLITPLSGQSFTDVPPTYWAYRYIETLYAHGVVSGYTAQQCAARGAAYPCFLPSGLITRAEMVKMVVIANGTPLYYGPLADYPDVPPTYWAYEYIKTATYKQWVGGYPDGTFRPGIASTRAELCKVVYLALIFPQGYHR